MRSLIIALLVLAGSSAFAQVDTLAYDDIAGVSNAMLMASSVFPGELDVIYNATFTPLEKCTLNAVQIGFGMVKFDTTGTGDTLIVYVFETSPVPPELINIVKTYRYPLGNYGFPDTNISSDLPLDQGLRDLLTVELDTPVVIAPKRDFIIGVKVLSQQSRDIGGQAVWNGFAICMQPNVKNFERYHRYSISEDPSLTVNSLCTDAGYASLLIRAIVTNDASLPDSVAVTSAAGAPVPAGMSLDPVYPNPFTSSAGVSFTLEKDSRIRLSVLDMLGREIEVLHNGTMPSGRHNVNMNPGRLAAAAGPLFIRLSTDGGVLVRTAVMLR
jgi:hypothetical protein